MPPKGKGLSFNQKRERLLRIFTERKDVFNYPQIEKEAEKVGIRRDVVKEILESLISDTLVDVETLGAGRVYWSLPSQAYQRLKLRNEEVQKQLNQADEKKMDLQKQIEQLQIGREITEERQQVERQLNEIQKQYINRQKELQIYQRFDPERVQSLKQETKVLQDKSINWSDDICQLIYYLKNQAGISADNMDQLGLPSNYE